MTVLSRRERVREATINEIKEIAWAQMADNGAAGLSMGAIARAMGMTPPALYRYFDNRDALVTALILDAFHSLADALETAVSPLGVDETYGRFQALLFAYRRWALANAPAYTLIHGNPIAGYEMPPIAQRSGAVRIIRLIGALLKTADQQQPLIIPDAYLEPPIPLQKLMQPMRDLFSEEEIPSTLLTLTIMIWIRVHGLVWTELHGHLPADLLESGELFRMEVTVISQQIGLVKSRSGANP